MSERYEVLRAAALGELLPLEARNGLALFLRRGMWSWAQAPIVTETAPRAERLSRPLSFPGEDREVVQLLATLAMRSTKQRNHERIAQSPVSPSRA